MQKYFEILKKDSANKARTGVIHTAHGDVATPAFLPIGTKGSVKSVTSEELKFWGSEMILANTYHLWQRPGDALIYKAGGLHKFMNWPHAIFTDSGGYQVFSLAKMRKVSETGVNFQFDLDGKPQLLSPEKSVQIQANLGSDIALILDDFPGYAIGGVAVGEPTEDMLRAVDFAMPHLEEEKPKHLLGVGTPYDIVQAVTRGCDTFDCVIPTREARHGRLYIAAADASGKDGYRTIDIRKAEFAEDFTAVDSTCDCYGCLHHTRAYIRHLFANEEALSIRLATMHNLRFYLNLMKKIRQAIGYDYFQDLAEHYKAH